MKSMYLKRVTAILLCVAMLLSMLPMAFAEEQTDAVAQIETGEYVIAAKVDDVYYAMSNTVTGGKALPAVIAVTDGKVSASDAKDYYITLTQTENGYTIYNGETYLSYSGTSTNLASATEPYYWVIGEGGNGTYHITSSEAPRALLYSVQDGKFGAYAENNSFVGKNYCDVELLTIDGEIEEEPETPQEPTIEVADGTYVIAANVDGVYYAMSNTFAAKIDSTVIAVTDGKVSASDAKDYYITLTQTENGYTIYNGETYLSYSGTAANLASVTEPYYWAIGEGGNGTYHITSSEAPRALLYSVQDGKFGAYAEANSFISSSYCDVELLPIDGEIEEEPETPQEPTVEIEDGYYVIAAKVGDTYYALNNDFGAMVSGEVINVNDGKVSSSDAMNYIVTVKAYEQGYTVHNGTKYLSFEAAPYLATAEEPFCWSVTYGKNGTYCFAATETDGMLYYAGANYFGGYALANSSEGSTLYYDVELLPIEGEIPGFTPVSIPSGQYVIAAKVGDVYHALTEGIGAALTTRTIPVTDGKVDGKYANGCIMNITATEQGYIISDEQAELTYTGTDGLLKNCWQILVGVNGTYRLAHADDITRGLAYVTTGEDEGDIFMGIDFDSCIWQYYDIEILPIEGEITELPHRVIPSGKYVIAAKIGGDFFYSYPYQSDYSTMKDMFGPTIGYELPEEPSDGTSVTIINTENGYLIHNDIYYLGYEDDANRLRQSEEPFYWWLTKGVHGNYRLTPANDPDRCLCFFAGAESYFSIHSSEAVVEDSPKYFDLALFPVEGSYAETPQNEPNCLVPRRNTDIILVLDDSNSMYEPYSNNNENLTYAMKGFVNEVFDNFNEGNNRIALVQFDLEARTWNGSSVNYQYSTNKNDYSGLTYNNCYLDSASDVMTAYGSLRTAPDQTYSTIGSTNLMGGLQMAEVVASLRAKDTTRDLVIILFTDGIPTSRYFTSSHNYTVDMDGMSTSAWEFMRALDAGESLRSLLENYKQCKSTIYNFMALNNPEYDERHEKIADYLFSNVATYQWTYDNQFDSSKYVDLTGQSSYSDGIVYVNYLSSCFTKRTPWADHYTKSFATSKYDVEKYFLDVYYDSGYSYVEHAFNAVSNDSAHVMTCAHCGYSYEDSHVVRDWTITKPATCTSTGTKEGYCRDCNAVQTEMIWVLSHKDVLISETPSTCTEHGEQVYQCSVCGRNAVNTLPLLPHSYEVTSVTPSTCIVAGEQTETCSVCGATQQTTLALGDHTYVETSLTPSTCIQQGVRVETCTLCAATRETLLDLSGHSYKLTSTTPSKCVVAGYNLFNCIDCGAERQVPLVLAEHKYEVTSVINPTCLESGLQTETCSVCGDVKETLMLPLGHKYKVETQPSTCTVAGKEIYTCDACGDSYETQLPLAEHTIVVAQYVAPKCNAEGYKILACELCGFWERITFEMTAHTATTVSGTPATCTQTGLSDYEICSYCEKVLVAQEELPALGHSYETVVTPPTCEAAGYTTYTCSTCGHSYDDDFRELLGHDCIYTDNGETHNVTCSRCDICETESHSFTDGTCICGAAEITEPIPDPNLKFSMDIVAGAEMVVNYNFIASIVSKYADFYLEVKKDVAGGEPVVTTFGITEDHVAMGSMNNPVTGEALMYNAAYNGICAKEMGDNFATTLYAIDANGKVYCGETVVSSIKTFLLGKLSDSNSIPEMKTMAVDMLNYGAVAQVNFDYDVENLVIADLTEDQLALGTQDVAEAADYATVSGTGANVNMNITVNSKVELSLSCIAAGQADPAAVKCVISDAEGKVLAELATVNIGGVMYSARYDNVGAKEMREVITATFYGADGAVISKTVSWSVESYVAQTRAKTEATETEISMVNAMLTYGDSVAAYMSATNQ